MKKLPPQKPGKSFQAYSTPRIFLEAVKKKFGIKAWVFDLAATYENTVADRFFGPLEERSADCCGHDALTKDWTKLKGDLWLNPPYADIAPWAAKCAASAFYDKRGNFLKCDRRIFFLVPAAVGSNWFADHVDGKALVVFPRPRLCFDGKAPYVKDVVLAVYGEKPDYQTWRWRP